MDNTTPAISRRALREAETARGRRRGRTRRTHPASAPAATVARPPGRSVSSFQRRAFGAVAMTFAAALMVSVSLPALAVNPAGPFAPTAASAAAAGESQQVEVGTDVTIAPVQRESYVAEKPPTVASYSQTAATYVNYPGAIQWPFLTGVPITTDFGPRIAPCGGCSTFHKGIDMNPGNGSPIQTIADGVVREVSATDNGGLGVYAVIDHTIDGELVSSVYAHMTEGELALSVGQAVSVGDLVGTVGNTGQSTGPHLHFEILLGGVTPTDPFAWLTERVVP